MLKCSTSVYRFLEIDFYKERQECTSFAYEIMENSNYLLKIYMQHLDVKSTILTLSLLQYWEYQY